MTDAELLRAMAQYFRGHTFTPARGDEYRRGCFITANGSVSTGRRALIDTPLIDVIGAEDFSKLALMAAGWTEGSTDDAIAACEIAADLAS